MTSPISPGTVPCTLRRRLAAGVIVGASSLGIAPSTNLLGMYSTNREPLIRFRNTFFPSMVSRVYVPKGRTARIRNGPKYVGSNLVRSSFLTRTRFPLLKGFLDGFSSMAWCRSFWVWMALRTRSAFASCRAVWMNSIRASKSSWMCCILNSSSVPWTRGSIP